VSRPRDPLKWYEWACLALIAIPPLVVLAAFIREWRLWEL
jgi:hypothetical protein